MATDDWITLQVIIHEKPSSGYNDNSDNWSYHQLLMVW